MEAGRLNRSSLTAITMQAQITQQLTQSKLARTTWVKSRLMTLSVDSIRKELLEPQWNILLALTRLMLWFNPPAIRIITINSNSNISNNIKRQGTHTAGSSNSKTKCEARTAGVCHLCRLRPILRTISRSVPNRLAKRRSRKMKWRKWWLDTIVKSQFSRTL